MALPVEVAPAATPVTLADVQAAARVIAGVADRTPLLPWPGAAALLGVPVFVKAELMQPVGAFKARGAYHAMARLDPAVRARGVVASSSGNHGQGVAWAARMFGVRAVIVMPESTPRVKVAGVRRHGGEVVFAGKVRSAEQARRAAELAAAEGLTEIPPFDHPDVIAGQGTMALEILEQCPAVGAIVAPIGGGGMLAGICTVVAALRPGLRVVAVEPAGAPKLSTALAAGHPVELGPTHSLADGLLTRAVGRFTFPVIREVVTDVVQVTDDQLSMAVRALHRDLGLRAEPSGAATAAALLAGLVPVAGPVVLVASGGNVDDDLFERLVAP